MTSGDTQAERNWSSLTPDQKLERRMAAWTSASGIRFESPAAEAAYKERVGNIADALLLKKLPTRVPVVPGLGGFAEEYCGYTHKETMYDVAKAIDVMNRCTLDFQPDVVAAGNAYPGRVWEALDFKLYVWPGHGLSDDAEGVQYVEDEYMPVGDYDVFIRDPNDYWNRVYLPRVLATMEPLTKIAPVLAGSGATAAIPSTVSAYGLPEVQASLQKMMAAGQEMVAWQQQIGSASRRLATLGFPTMGGGTSKAPFDLIGDSLRGTRAVVMDSFRRPGKLLDAIEALVPILIQMGVQTARMGACPLVGFALHKGADGFMSDEQYRTFYWGPLKKVVIGLIQEGLIPRMGAQGGYNSRLEAISDLPRGRTLWAFGAETDMKRAKEVMGDVACISGNVPASLVYAGSPVEIRDHCRQLIKTAGKGGGYLFATASGIPCTTRVENVRALMDSAMEFGVYR
jgi:hypothetical protein